MFLLLVAPFVVVGLHATSRQTKIQELDLSFLLEDFPYHEETTVEVQNPVPEYSRQSPFAGMFPDRSKLLMEELALDADVGEPLILTPLIKAGKIKAARDQAKVEGLTDLENYSGFFQVDETKKANLFFWYFPTVVSIKQNINL